jgi:carbon storage regulator
MLVLTRKREESVVVAGQIVITVLEIGRGRVRLGVQAPRDVTVFRGEVHQRMLANPKLETLVLEAPLLETSQFQTLEFEIA